MYQLFICIGRTWKKQANNKASGLLNILMSHFILWFLFLCPQKTSLFMYLRMLQITNTNMVRLGNEEQIWMSINTYLYWYLNWIFKNANCPRLKIRHKTSKQTKKATWLLNILMPHFNFWFLCFCPQKTSERAPEQGWAFGSHGKHQDHGGNSGNADWTQHCSRKFALEIPGVNVIEKCKIVKL